MIILLTNLLCLKNGKKFFMSFNINVKKKGETRTCSGLGSMLLVLLNKNQKP